MAKPWQKQPGNALAFGASDGADADDYYDFLPSDDGDILSGDEELSGDSAVASSAPVAGQQGIAMLASVPLTGRAADGGDAVAIAATATSSSAVLTSIGMLGAAVSGASDANSRREARPAQETLTLVASGAVILTGGKQLRVSPESLAKHASRKSQLESALDAFAMSLGNSIDSSNSASLADGEAPFRFRVSTSATDVEMADAEAPAAAQPAARSKQQHGEQMSGKSLKKMTAASMSKVDKEEETSGGETDPLYDDRMDDADEKWVQRNFRGQGGAETDATLCCPCCFMTVCMDCQRHVKFTNQYRSSAAVNCRVKKDEILTYTSGAASASALPFQKRLNLAATRSTSTSSGEAFSLLLTANEFYPVACSDCGTTVGVYDRYQQYHFFNVLPSNC